MSIRYTENLIPIMTSNTTPSGIVQASGQYSADYPPWKAFDGSIDPDRVWGSGTTSPKWISYEFPSPVKINKITIRCSAVDQAIKDFRIQGLNLTTGLWDDLLVKAGELPWSVGEKRDYTFDNNILYKTYRLYVNTTQGSIHLTIVEIEMMSSFYIMNHLVKSSNKIQVLSDENWIDTGLTEPLTKLDFETHGMDDLSIIPYEKWMELDNEFEIITWTNEPPKEIEDSIQGEQKQWLEDGKLFEISVDRDIKAISDLVLE